MTPDVELQRRADACLLQIQVNNTPQSPMETTLAGMKNQGVSKTLPGAIGRAIAGSSRTYDGTASIFAIHPTFQKRISAHPTACDSPVARRSTKVTSNHLIRNFLSFLYG
jgi:hypothetical protein